jgi:hypothetical protein
MRFRFTLAALIIAQLADAAPFSYDPQLAIDLARAYVHSHFRARPDHAIPGLDYRKPVVVARIVSERHLVFVAFTSPTDKGAASVAFEQCQDRDLLIAADSSATDDAQALLEDLRSIKPSDYVAIPKVCLGEGD